MMKKATILVLVLYGLGSMSILAVDSEPGTTTAKTETQNAAKLPKLLDLGAKKCIPCKKMAPILDELTLEFKGIFDVEFIDVWQPENRDKAKSYGIQSIPTQIFFDANGKELWRHVGFISKEDILKKWQELGFKFNTSKKDDQPAKAAT